MTAALRVRAHLLEADFTADGVLARVGSAAFAALGRGLTVPVRRALSGEPAADVDPLIALFLLGEPVAVGVLPGPVAADLATLGLVRVGAEQIVPLLEVHPYGEPDTDWFIVSDIGAPSSPDHVLGLGGASLTLAQITPRVPRPAPWTSAAAPACRPCMRPGTAGTWWPLTPTPGRWP